MPSKVTIETVARHANVSRQTVSNVLNAPDMVRDETRARVVAAIEELGYRTNNAARQMRTGRSNLIGVRIDPIRNGIEASVLDRFLHGLTEAATPAGYRVVLYTAADDESEVNTYDDLLAAYAVDAFVLTHTHYDDSRTSWLREHYVPFTTFGRSWSAPEQHSWIDVDGAGGTAAATRHLIAAGHRRIGFIGWPEGSAVGDDRRRGWSEAMHQADLDTDGLARFTPDGVDQGATEARSLDGATAVVCASDPLAFGAWRARASGADRLAVIGFDDTPVAQALGLSSIRQPLAQVAAACIETVSMLLNDTPHDGIGEPARRQVLLEPELIVRDSG